MQEEYHEFVLQKLGAYDKSLTKNKEEQENILILFRE